MKILISSVPEDSHDFRIWTDLPQSDGDNGEDYQVTGAYHRIDEDTCEIARVLGQLSDEINILIGLGAVQLGYRYLEFHRSLGGLVSRWATLVKREDGMDYYRVDLDEAVKIYEKRGTE